MDLSSLEGPPIQDSRFTVTDIPRIHLDIDSPIWPTTPIHPALRNDLPPRPASSGADTTRKYQKTNETPSARRKSEEITSPTSNLLHPVDGRGFWPLENPERRPRARSQPPNSNQHNSGNRLIWLDQERIWIRLEPGDSSTGTGNGNGTNENAAPTTTNIRSPPPLSHSRSADSYLRGPPSMNVDGTGMSVDMDTDVDMDMDITSDEDDLPPPYENHYNDPILSPQPARPLARRGRVSPWAAVARRMNR